jgi:spore coat polysaccharide biosynthesis predicted glycosyltransferase SpsG
MKRFLFVANDKNHLERCLATAEIMSKYITLKSLFITNKKSDVRDSYLPETDLLKQIISLSPDVVIFDQHRTKADLINGLKARGIKTVSQCYIDNSRSLCDVKISIVRTENYDKPTYYEGAEYCLLGREFYKNGIRIKQKIKKIIVNLNHKEAENKLLNALRRDFSLTFVNNLRPAQIKQHDLAITPLNYSLFQCLATGIPTMIISLNDREEEQAKIIEQTQSTIHIGNIKNLSVNKIRGEVQKLNHQPVKRKRMHFHAKQLVNRKSWDNIHKIYRALTR